MWMWLMELWKGGWMCERVGCGLVEGSRDGSLVLGIWRCGSEAGNWRILGLSEIWRSEM